MTASAFEYRDGELFCEGVRAAGLAEQFGTPLYVYSHAAFTGQLRAMQDAFAAVNPLVCYSVKANSNLGVLRALAEAGSGFDVVSWGEFHRVITAGGDPHKTVFAGVGKTDEEISNAIDAGVLMFNVESEAELDAISKIGVAKGVKAPIALRVNPDVDPKTHRYISTGKKESKFGMDIERSLALAKRVAETPGVEMVGMHMHIGSQITSVEPYGHAATKGVEIVAELKRLGHPIQWYNFGGGFGISYRGSEGHPIRAFADVIVPAVQATGCRLALEPGRVIAGNSGILLSRVIFTKQSGDKTFLIQDAAMNDLIRPALYQSYHRMWPVNAAVGPPDEGESPAGTIPQDVVGPICESGDFLAQDRPLPPMVRGDLLATFSAGAYGMVMASNYNSRPRAAEILVQGNNARIVRRRETLEELLAPELFVNPKEYR